MHTPHNYSVQRCAQWYASLIRWYPNRFYQRFSEELMQTFRDLCHDHLAQRKNLAAVMIWVCAETILHIIKEHIASVTMYNKNIVRIALGTGALLMIPLIAMQFTSEVNWTASDFVFAGTLLFGAGLTYELISRRARQVTYKAAVGIAALTTLLLIWVNGAVGIIGDNNPANALYLGVIAAGIIGAAASRLYASGLALTLFVMATAQLLVPIIALIYWPTNFAPGVLRVFVFNACFAGLFIASGLLFKRASIPVTPSIAAN